MEHEPEIKLAIAERRIAWVLDHPAFSDWLKDALWSARICDPVAVQNDIEMLRHLIAARSTAQIEGALANSENISI
ncbi:hypothetical protein [Sphingomonas paucimobilis]|uniref:hypothetical protein n=1 Tax=Sphingomonas paucimobilis TaxID=13689 RepID=UPI0028D53037|nr:hypothetical protein [Sphingomonas paucimobilis]